MKYASLDTEQISKVEKGEGSHLLLDDDLVKPLPSSAYSSSSSSFRPLRCLIKTIAALAIILLVILLAFSMGTYIWMRHQVHRITVRAEKDMPSPPLPVAPLPQAALEVIKDEAKLFWDQLRANMEPAHDLEITQDQMNGLIASSEYLRGHAFVTIHENEWHTDWVLPAEKLPGGRGRYFMGETFATTEQDDVGTRLSTVITPQYHIQGLDYETILSGQFLAYFSSEEFSKPRFPIVHMEYGQFMNWVAPQEWIDRHENILDCNNVDKHDDDFDRRDCQDLMAVLGRLESISLQDEKIVFKARRDGESRRRQLEEVEADDHVQAAADDLMMNKNASPKKNRGPSSLGGYIARRALKGLF